jgi:hypothetical protein
MDDFQWPQRRFERGLLILDSDDMPTQQFSYTINKEYILSGYFFNGELNVCWRNRQDALGAANRYLDRSSEQQIGALDDIAAGKDARSSVQLLPGRQYARDHDSLSARINVPTQIVSLSKLIIDTIDTQMPVTQEDVKNILVAVYKHCTLQEQSPSNAF